MGTLWISLTFLLSSESQSFYLSAASIFPNADTVFDDHSESGSNSPPRVEALPTARITTLPRYPRQEFLLEHVQTLFCNLPDWSTDELRWAPKHLTPYLGLLRRTGYPTLHAENLLRLSGYWAAVVGEFLAIHVIQRESMNSHFGLVDLNCTLIIADQQLIEACELLHRLHVWVQGHNGHARRLAAAKDRDSGKWPIRWMG